MVAGDNDDDRVRKRRLQSDELAKGVENCGVRRTRGVKHVAGDKNDLGLEFDDPVDGALKGARHVRLPLIDASRSETLVLPVPEMKIREMDEAHAQRRPSAQDPRSACNLARAS